MLGFEHVPSASEPCFLTHYAMGAIENSENCQ